MTHSIGTPVSRVDGPAKVTGGARYAGEFRLPGLVHAALVGSTIPAGRIVAIETAAAEACPGVLAVLHQGNAEPRVFGEREIHHFGQAVAVVVAETLEQAVEAAARVEVRYEAAPARLRFDPAAGRPPEEEDAESGRGDADAALATAPVTVDARYLQAREHHNAMEPHVTVASWEDGGLTLYDKTQWVTNVRDEVAEAFGLDKDRVRVVSPFVGGAFGSSLRVWPHVTIAALAARSVGRPVRLELSRRALYSAIGFRPHTEQRVALGADRQGRLTAILQEAWGQTAAHEEYAETTLHPAQTSYACPNVRTRYRLVEMNTNPPCPMRAPGIVTGNLALEMAMDELAERLGLDPMELRLRNDAGHDQRKDLPWTSKRLETCYRTAAGRFGWERRDPEPGSMWEGHERIGYGMATAIYQAHRAPASASATLFANGSALLRSAASDMGPGTYTAMTQVAGEVLGLPLDRIRFELGDSTLPPAPVHGGSITMASVGNAVAEAARSLQDRLVDLARRASDGPFAGLEAEAIVCRDGALARADGSGPSLPYGELLRRHQLDSLEAAVDSEPGEESEHYAASAFGAIFVEVRVDPALGTVRVPRMVGAYDVGRVINPKLARSQCLGGMVGGLGMALFEQAEWDERLGRVMNANLAEYLVPVCADIGELDVSFVENDDRTFNPLGAKGLAEVAICGVAPAIANAVYHAIGRRIRALPITPERLLCQSGT